MDEVIGGVLKEIFLLANKGLSKGGNNLEVYNVVKDVVLASEGTNTRGIVLRHLYMIFQWLILNQLELLFSLKRQSLKDLAHLVLILRQPLN